MAKIPKIQFKRSKTSGIRPSKDNLAEGELAINLADRMLFTKSGEEIIDLGFAKGGTVNGDIIQETGNFTTNGFIKAKTNIDIKNNKDDNKTFRLSYEDDRALLAVNAGDNNWKTLQIPLDEDGTKTIATREWSNSNKVDKSGDTLTGTLKWTNKDSNVYTQDIESNAVNDATAKNFIRKFRNRSGGYLWHELVDENGLSYYTGTSPDQLRVQLGVSGVRIDGGSSYKFTGPVSKAGIDAVVRSGAWAEWESRPALVQMRVNETNGAATLYKVLGSTGKAIASFGAYSTNGEKSGISAQFKWGDSSIVYWNKGMTIENSDLVVKNGTYSKLVLSDHSKNNDASFIINDNGIPYLEWKTAGSIKGQLFMSSGNVATREWTNTMIRSSTTETMINPPDGTKYNMSITNTGSFTTWNGSYNPVMINNTGSMSLRGNISAVEQVNVSSPDGTIFGIFVRNGQGFLSMRDAKGNWVGELSHPLTSGIIATRQWSNSQHYIKSETYNKSEIDGKVNGRLTQAQGDARYVSISATNLGSQYTPLTTIQSGQWGKPIGYSVMVNSNSPQRPPGTNLGYWHVIAARDTGNGYAGIFGDYGGGKMFYGEAGTNGTNPTWHKIYTEAQKPTPGELGVYAKGEVYSRAESDARYPLKGNVYTKGESDGKYVLKSESTSSFRRMRKIGTVKFVKPDSWGSVAGMVYDQDLNNKILSFEGGLVGSNIFYTGMSAISFGNSNNGSATIDIFEISGNTLRRVSGSGRPHSNLTIWEYY